MVDKFFNDNDKVYEDSTYNTHYKKLMDKENSTYALPNDSYSEDKVYSDHYQKVFSGDVDDYDLPTDRYFENPAFNERFVEIVKTGLVPPTLKTISKSKSKPKPKPSTDLIPESDVKSESESIVEG